MKAYSAFTEIKWLTYYLLHRYIYISFYTAGILEDNRFDKNDTFSYEIKLVNWFRKKRWSNWYSLGDEND